MEANREKVTVSARNKSAPGVEVLDVDVLVGRRLALAPEQQALLGRHLFDRDVLDGEAQNDGPDHAQRHLDVAVDDLFCADADQLIGHNTKLYN